MTNPLGLYIHIPFCAKKCNYCDFYSLAPNGDAKRHYINRICEELTKWGGQTVRPIDTVYIGGGTPSLLSEDELDRILSSVKASFTLQDDAEITCEINPGDNAEVFLSYAAKHGVNRISVGVQSANEDELKMLGRRHSFADAQKAVSAARKAGINNISADIMIGLPGSTADTLQNSIDKILSLSTEHLSAYILKLEQGTPFFKDGVILPDEDATADQYLMMCKAFERAGYEHYEISNFAKRGFQSRHNNKYWLCEEYIGIGPAAHSFFEGKRFYYPRSLEDFLESGHTLPDGSGGDKDEYIMLALRLSRGLKFKELWERFGTAVSPKFIEKAKFFEKQGLLTVNDTGISLTDEGMLLSNAVISALINL